VDRRATSLSIALFPPKGYDEMAFYRKVAAFVEERETSPLEWFIKHDIYPVQKNLHVSGGIVGRGVVDGMANFENTSKSQVGLVLALVALVGFLGSPRQAGISLFLIVLSMLGARGSIAVLSELGFGFRETVFFSLVMANILVQGFSFNLRMFEKWNEAHRRDKLATREKVWKSVGENIRGMLFLVGFMSILNFLILSRTEVRPLFEVAILSALGICFSLLPALFLLPSLHLVLGGVPKHGGRLAFLSRFFNWLAERVVYWAQAVNRKMGQAGSWWAFGLVSVLAGLAITIWISGRVSVESREMEYTLGTHIERSSNFMMEEGRPGFASMDIVIEAVDGVDYKDPNLVNDAWSFAREIRGEHTGIREVASVFSALEHLGQETWKTDPWRMARIKNGSELFETREEVSTFYLAYVESGLDPEMRKELYNEKAYRLIATFPANGSVFTGNLLRKTKEIATQHPNLKVSFGGRMALYPTTDEYLRENQLSNFLWGDVLLAGVMALIIWIQNSRTGKEYMKPLQAGLCLCLPFTISSAVIWLLMWVLQIPLDMATAATGALCLNASLDFSLYMVMAFRQKTMQVGSERAGEEALEEEGRPVFADALVNLLCFSMLSTSVFLPVSRLGILVSVMLLVSAMAALFLMPAALRFAVGKDGQRGRLVVVRESA
jgi:predicted RND superfamily exporter protein